MEKILRQNIEGMREYCKNARVSMPNVFQRRVRARGFSLHLDADGKRVDVKKTPDIKPAKSIFCIKKEDKCRRCGYEYTDVKGEPKATECPECKLKYALAGQNTWSLPGINFKRESATRMVAKNYMDQARSLVGAFPVTLGDWFTQEGINQIANILAELDKEEQKFIEASKPVERKLVRITNKDKKNIFAGFNELILTAKKKAS